MMIVYQGKKVVLPDGYIGPASILIQNGKIEKIYRRYPFDAETSFFEVRSEYMSYLIKVFEMYNN